MSLMLFLLLLAPGELVEHMQVTDIQPIDGFSASSQVPQAMLWQPDRLYVLDGDARLWLVGAQGRPAGAGEDQPLAAVRGLYAIAEQIVVVDQNGYRRTAYDSAGKLQGSAMLRQPVLYSDQDNQLQAVDQSPEADGRAVQLHWTHQGQTRQLELVATARNDRVPPDSIVTLALGQHLLSINGSGRRATLYYTLLDLASGKVAASGTLPVASVGPTDGLPDRPVALLVGAAANPELGFVVTEAPSRNGERALRLLAPLSDSWRTFVIALPAGKDLTFFQPLEGDRWLAFDGTQLLRFRLQPQ